MLLVNKDNYFNHKYRVNHNWTWYLKYVIKNVSSSVSHKNTPGLLESVIWDFSFFLSNTFVYEPILFKLSMNANIVKMQIFHKIKSDLTNNDLFDKKFAFSSVYVID